MSKNYYNIEINCIDNIVPYKMSEVISELELRINQRQISEFNSDNGKKELHTKEYCIGYLESLIEYYKDIITIEKYKCEQHVLIHGNIEFKQSEFKIQKLEKKINICKSILSLIE